VDVGSLEAPGFGPQALPVHLKESS
jgi:hypothetical protein